AVHLAVRAKAPPYLFAAGPGRLARRALASGHAGIFLQLVGAVERRDVRRGRQAGPDTEAGDRRAARQHRTHLVLVEAAAGEDRRASETALVENAADPDRLRREVAAINPDRFDLYPERLEARRQCHDLPRGGVRVVSID